MCNCILNRNYGDYAVLFDTLRCRGVDTSHMVNAGQLCQSFHFQACNSEVK